MKIYRYGNFSHKSCKLYFLLYHQEKPWVISICFTLPQKSFKLTLTQADLATSEKTHTRESQLFLNAARKAVTFPYKEIILPSENLRHLNPIHIPSQAHQASSHLGRPRDQVIRQTADTPALLCEQ